MSSKASLDSPSGTVGNTASIGLIQDSRDFSSNCHSSDTGLNVTREGGLSQSQPIAVALTNLSCDPSPSSVHPRETSVADTYEWLISAGVPFSAFDPIAIETYFPNDLLSKNTFSDLIDCADEITSLFSSPSCEVPSSQTVAISFVSRDDSLQSLNTITGSIENSCVY